MLQLNPISDQALSSLAAPRSPYLNLPLADKSPEGSYLQGQTQSLFNSADLNEKYAQINNTMNVAQMTRNTELMKTAYQAKMEMDKQVNQQQFQGQQDSLNRANTLGIAQMNNQSKQQEIQQQGQFQQGMLGYRQGELQNQQDAQSNLQDYHTQQLKIQQAHEDILARAQLNKEDEAAANKRGAAAEYALQKFQSPQFQALPPEEQNKQANAYFAQTHGLGVTNDSEYQQLLNTDLTGKLALLHYDLGVSHAGKQVSNVNITNQQPGYSALTPATKEQTQKDVQTGMDVTNRLQDLIDTNKPEFYSTGMVKTGIGKLEAGLSQLGMPQGDLAKLDADKQGYFAKAKAVQGPLIQELGAKFSSRTVSQTTPMQITGDEANDKEANAKAQALMDVNKVWTKMKQDQLQYGIPLNEKTMSDQLDRANKNLQKVTNPEASTSANASTAANGSSSASSAQPLDVKSFSSNDWARIAQAHGVSPNDPKFTTWKNQQLGVSP